MGGGGPFKGCRLLGHRPTSPAACSAPSAQEPEPGQLLQPWCATDPPRPAGTPCLAEPAPRPGCPCQGISGGLAWHFCSGTPWALSAAASHGWRQPWCTGLRRGTRMAHRVPGRSGRATCAHTGWPSPRWCWSPLQWVMPAPSLRSTCNWIWVILGCCQGWVLSTSHTRTSCCYFRAAGPPPLLSSSPSSGLGWAAGAFA